MRALTAVQADQVLILVRPAVSGRKLLLLCGYVCRGHEFYPHLKALEGVGRSSDTWFGSRKV
jgi:hypothetical protein